jgi:orotate phosphoribosyltransferase-like protein
MARRKSVDIDLDTAHRLKSQGVPTAEIARQLKLPVSTLRDHLKRALRLTVHFPAIAPGAPGRAGQGIRTVVD